MSIRLFRFSRRLTASLASFLAASSLFMAVPAWADTAATPGGPDDLPPVPQRIDVDLGRGGKGANALGMLKKTNRLPEWSAGYGMTAGQAESLFTRDSRAYVDRRGFLKFVEHIDRPILQQTQTTQAIQTPQTAGTAIDPGLAFQLHSRPNSSRKLYLDFNGHVTQGTAWNDSYRIGSINSPAFDLDGVANIFSDQERAVIIGIWQRVKEDFSPFDIDVTTEEPPADQMTRTSSTDGTFGIRVVVTKDFTPGTAEGACQCGGFAYVGVFSAASEYNKPAFVFYDNLGSSEKFVAEAVTHEAGHTMGLSHDGQGSLGYYEGQGTGITGWAPIMGVGYYKALTQWSKGEYTSANNREDDYLVMQNNGVRFAPDEHGNTPATASTLAPTVLNGRNSFRAEGVIQGPADIDYFRFTAGAGPLTVNVNPDPKDPNLDVVATVFNSAGQSLLVTNPLNALNAVLQLNVTTPGTYFLAVRGTGQGNPLTTGYSAYGSIGSYSVDISAPLPTSAAPPPVPRLNATPVQGAAPLRVTFNANGSTGTGTLTYNWSFGDGTQATGIAPPAKTYQNAGQYTVTLRVTDPAGQSSMATTVIQAQAQQARSMAVNQIVLTGVVPNPSRPDAFVRASVRVVDAAGRVVPNAQVAGTWSGVVNGPVSGRTNAQGIASLASPSTPFVGTFTFTLNNITATGFVYDPTRNTMNSRSLTF